MKDKLFTVTKGWLSSNSTKRGGYTKAQIQAVGLKYPLEAGWMNGLIGRNLTQKQKLAFEGGRVIFSESGKFSMKYKKNKIQPTKNER